MSDTSTLVLCHNCEAVIELKPLHVGVVKAAEHLLKLPVVVHCHECGTAYRKHPRP